MVGSRETAACFSEQHGPGQMIPRTEMELASLIQRTRAFALKCRFPD